MRKGAFLVLSVLFIVGASQNVSASDLPVPVKSSIKLERTICYGTCPSYTVEVDQNGNVTYVGREFVAQKGVRTSTVSPESVQVLVDKFKAINFLSLPQGFEKNCQEHWTDNPSVIITFTYAGETRSVDEYHGCRGGNLELEKVREIENEIDKTLNTRQWIN